MKKRYKILLWIAAIFVFFAVACFIGETQDALSNPSVFARIGNIIIVGGFIFFGVQTLSRYEEYYIFEYWKNGSMIETFLQDYHMDIGRFRSIIVDTGIWKEIEAYRERHPVDDPNPPKHSFIEKY